jgi:hypothetical protein
VPALQLEHADAPVAVANVPAAQLAQRAAPDAEKAPAPQLVHEACPGEL